MMHSHNIEKERPSLFKMSIEFSKKVVVVFHRRCIRCFEFVWFTRGLTGETRRHDVLE